MSSNKRELFKDNYKIGEVSDIFAVSTDTLRYYEKVGLIKPKRKDNSYRIYSFDDVWKINFILNLKKLNFSLDSMKTFLENRNIKNTIEHYKVELEIIREEIEYLKETEKNILDVIKYVDEHNKNENLEKVILKSYDRRKCIDIINKATLDEDIDYEINKFFIKDKENLVELGRTLVAGIISKDSLLNDETQEYKSLFFILEDSEAKADFILEKGDYLSIIFKGSYEKSKDFCEKIWEYSLRNKIDISDDIIELYHIDNLLSDYEDEFITEIQVKVISDKV